MVSAVDVDAVTRLCVARDCGSGEGEGCAIAIVGSTGDDVPDATADEDEGENGDGDDADADADDVDDDTDGEGEDDDDDDGEDKLELEEDTTPNVWKCMSAETREKSGKAISPCLVSAPQASCRVSSGSTSCSGSGSKVLYTLEKRSGKSR
jgi:hypothetical protein